MIYLKMRSESKWDSIKREYLIFTETYLRSRQRRANYVYVSASCQSNGGGGREGDLKNVRTSGKILATPLIYHSAFAICVSAVHIRI